MIGDTATGLAVGLVLGAVHLLWLWRAARRLGAGGAGTGALVAGAALRLGLTVAVLALLARHTPEPAMALVAALAGLVVMRSIALRRLRRTEGRGC